MKEEKICKCLDLKEHKDKELIDEELLVKYYECKKCGQKSKNTYESFVIATTPQLREEEFLKNRIVMARRGLSDTDGRVRESSHKAIDKFQKMLKKLNDKIYSQKVIDTEYFDDEECLEK